MLPPALFWRVGMNEDKTPYPAAGLAGNRAMRCFIASLFTAGVSLACISLFEMARPAMQPYLFGLVLFAGFIGAQIQERMRRMTSPE